MIYLEATDYRYSLPVTEITGQNIYFPVEIDTEYTHQADYKHQELKLCTNITAQCRAITETTGKIYDFPDIASYSRHKLIETNFVVWDYLKDLGLKITPLENGYENVPDTIPWIQIDCYAYFAIAEFPRVFLGHYAGDYDKLIVHSNTRTGIEQGRRLRTFHREGFQYLNWIETPWLILINNHIYSVRLSIYDTSAVHGITNYATFCSNSGVKLKYKDIFTKAEKAKMLDMYNLRPDEFDDYALGDLYNYDALLGNSDNFEKIYKSLGIQDYFTDPKLTIGATVSRIIESSINNLFHAEPDTNDYINLFCRFGSAEYLKNLSTTGAMNAKVDGGRCRNNRPTDTFLEGVICDNDIAGCYGEGLRVQDYPLGIPSILDYPRNTDNNEYLTLRQFLKKYQEQLIPGLWQARVSLRDGYLLENKQDYLASFIPPKSMRSLSTDDASHLTEKWWEIDAFGETKIFENEIINAVVTHDYMQWLAFIAVPKLRNELLDNLIVTTAMWYSRLDRVDSPIELIHAHAAHKGINTTEIKYLKGRQRKVSIQEECHKWFSINLGELIVDKLLIERKKYPKKTPLNNLYKLCINTVYGDMVSPFFKVGNVVVGNNITARARALAWYMEKGFHGFQTITDGCAFDLNKIACARENRKLNSTLSLHQYSGDNKQHLMFLPLQMTSSKETSNKGILRYIYHRRNIIKIYHDNSRETVDKDTFIQQVNKHSLIHLQYQFPSVDVLHKPSKDVYGNRRIGQFEFEVKDIYTKGTFHGSGNYYLVNDTHEKIAMRSYKKGVRRTIVLEDGELIDFEMVNPAEKFLKSLEHFDSIDRSNVFIKDRILKIGDYRNNYLKWSETRAFPGCTVFESRLLKEFSLGQFTFNTYQQYKSWQRQMIGLIKKYYQSYEMFFLDDEGNLNYQEMVEAVEKSIRADDTRYHYSRSDLNRNAHRKFKAHNESDCLDKSKDELDKLYRKRDKLN